MLPRRISLRAISLLWLLHSAGGQQDSARDSAAVAAGNLQSGNYPAAAEVLRSATKRFPNDAELWNLLGIANTELKQVAAAETAFDRGLKLTPNSTSLLENAGLLFFREANYQRAKELLARAVSLGSDKPGVLFSLAAAKLRTGEEEEALRELRGLEPALAATPEYWEERGRGELLRDPVAAETSFGRALEKSPQSPTALNGAAAAAEKQGSEEKALAYLIRARAAAPRDVPTLLHFAAVCIRRDLGLDAVEALETARRIEPANSSVVYLLARANISLQNWQQAFDLFSEYSRTNPSFAPTYYALGWLDIKLGRAEDARRQLAHCLQLDPSLADARYELARLEIDDGQADLAEPLLEAILREHPEHAKASVALGEIKMRSGDLANAQKLLEAAIRTDPKSSAAHYKLAVVYLRQHEQGKSAGENALAAQLNAEEKRASKTQLRLVLPGGESAR